MPEIIYKEESYPLFYKGRQLRKEYEPDIVCFEKIVVELKAVSNLTDEHRAQLINYLRGMRMKLGLLVNYGRPGGSSMSASFSESDVYNPSCDQSSGRNLCNQPGNCVGCSQIFRTSSSMGRNAVTGEAGWERRVWQLASLLAMGRTRL